MTPNLVAVFMGIISVSVLLVIILFMRGAG